MAYAGPDFDGPSRAERLDPAARRPLATSGGIVAEHAVGFKK